MRNADEAEKGTGKWKRQEGRGYGRDRVQGNKERDERGRGRVVYGGEEVDGERRESKGKSRPAVISKSAPDLTTDAFKYITEKQESPADAKVTRDSSARMKAYGRNLSSAGNPTLKPNITLIGEPVVKLWSFCVSKMAVSRHLGFYRFRNSAIRSADSESHRIKHGVDRMHRLRIIRL